MTRPVELSGPMSIPRGPASALGRCPGKAARRALAPALQLVAPISQTYPSHGRGYEGLSRAGRTAFPWPAGAWMRDDGPRPGRDGRWNGLRQG